jgi:hypothetical protein
MSSMVLHGVVNTERQADSSESILYSDATKTSCPHVSSCR